MRNTTKLFIGLVLSIMLSVSAFASSCPQFTAEQRYLLSLAREVGQQDDQELHDAIGDTIGYTQAATIWKESFVGRHVIRFRPSDGALGSYGVGHVQLTTSFHMRGLDNTWENRDKVAPRLIYSLLTNDTFAIQESYSYLRLMMINEGNIWYGVKRYNGVGPRADAYMEDVKNRVNTLILCRKSIFG